MVDESKEKGTTHITVTQETKADLEAIGKVRNISGYNNIIQQLDTTQYHNIPGLHEYIYNLENDLNKEKSLAKMARAGFNYQIALHILGYD